ncbi:mitochondrial antiviral-signaling protein [Macrotis lagotis]|uniref:mitochondrial antiviral-signaling protein n=1 Tax=Macrotis lagotis TaxID=92651 RepID=UPI003D68280C
MPLAEERTEQYIRFHLSDFFRIDVLEILSHLPCLTPADQDSIRAYIDRRGNRDSVWKLFDHLPKRSGWVTCLITALRECELTDLADVIANVYASNQTRFHNRLRDQAAPGPPVAPSSRSQQVLPVTPPQPSAGIPRPHPPTHPAPSLPDTTTYNGYPEEQEREKAGLSHTAPIQDTQPPKTEVTGVTLNPAHSADTSKNTERSSRHSSFSAPALTGTGEHHRASGGSGDSPPASAFPPTSSHGPLSPSVSFVARSSKKAGPTSGPQSASPPGKGSSSSPHQPMASSQVNENQIRATSPSQGPGLPPGREPPTRSSVEVLPLTPKLASSPQPGPAPLGQAPPSWEDETRLSKPGLLKSCNEEPYSGGSERLLFSGSAQGSMGSLHISPSSGNLPEENDYSSVTSVPSPGKPEASGSPRQPGGSKTSSLSTFELHVEERPGECPLRSCPGPDQTPGPAAPSGGGPSGDGSWGVWLGSAVAMVLFSVALAVLYKRIQK